LVAFPRYKYDPPLLASFVGRRRGWIIVSQIAVMLALAGVAFGDPGHWIVWTVVVSLVLVFAGATQDVTIDSWRITAAPPGKQSLMTAFSEAGYRVGTLAAGARALIAADAATAVVAAPAAWRSWPRSATGRRAVKARIIKHIRARTQETARRALLDSREQPNDHPELRVHRNEQCVFEIPTGKTDRPPKR
jgi:hypothetical protein